MILEGEISHWVYPRKASASIHLLTLAILLPLSRGDLRSPTHHVICSNPMLSAASLLFVALSRDEPTDLVFSPDGHHALIGQGTKRWDTAAPEALLRASGGFCVDAQGRPYDYSESCEPRNDEGVIAGGCIAAWQQCVDAYGWKDEAFPS